MISHKILLKIIFVSTILEFNNLFSQNFDWGGYSKYLLSYSKIEGVNENLLDHIIHTRFNFRYYFNDNSNISFALRNKLIFGNSIEKIPSYVENLQDKKSLIRLNEIIIKRGKITDYIEVDRFYLTLLSENFQFDIGKQRIAWGTSWVWNITDLFNPLSILDFDYEERPAIDGIRFQYFPGILTKIDLAIKPEKSLDKFTSAIQVSTNFLEYDIYFLTGIHKNRFFIGSSWAGNIWDAGFRGEFIAFQPPSKLNSPILHIFKNEKRTQISCVLSFDYTFSNSLYLHSEILYNNIGAKDSLSLIKQESLELGLLSPAKISLFYQIGYNISPLVRLDIFSLHNPIDKSLALLPSFNYSFSQDLDFSLILLFIFGKNYAEFFPNSKMYFGRVKYSF